MTPPTSLSSRALQLMEDSYRMYRGEYIRREALLETAEEGTFNTDNPQSVSQKVNGQLMYLARLKAQQQITLHEFTLTSATADSSETALVQQAFEAALALSGFRGAFDAATPVMLGVGDAFMSFGASPEYLARGTGFPAQYRFTPTARLFFPDTAVELRSPGSGRDARRMVRLTTLPLAQARTLYPWISDGTSGRAPLSWTETKPRGDVPTPTSTEDLIDILEYFDLDLDSGTVAFFAGSSLQAGPVRVGQDYPFLSRLREPYLPAIHRKCLSISQGILNRGIFHLSYKLAMLERILRNMGFGYQVKNLDPVKVIAIPGMKETDFRVRHQDAVDAQAQMKEGVIFTPGQQASVQSFRTQPIIAEMTACIEQLRDDFLLWGINLRDMVTDPAKTAYAVQAEGAAQTSFIRFLQRQNVLEMQKGLEMLLDFTQQYVPADCSVPLFVTSVTKDGLTRDMTYGDLAEQLRSKQWKITMQEASGIVNPHVYERTLNDRLIARLMQFGPTDALFAAIENDARLDGRRLDLSSVREKVLGEGTTKGHGMKKAPKTSDSFTLPLQ